MCMCVVLLVREFQNINLCEDYVLLDLEILVHS